MNNPSLELSFREGFFIAISLPFLTLKCFFKRLIELIFE